ncbi:hypothetical protein PWT90_06724 [Aphanocladium album]|nr:hypothetical protein PWT90_06724 [Aphanocladium album]
MAPPKKTQVHPILMGLESHLHSRTIFRPTDAENFGRCRAIVTTTSRNCTAHCPAQNGEDQVSAKALRQHLTSLTAVSDKEQLYGDVAAFVELAYCGRHRGKKTLVEGLARWKAELDEFEPEPCPASSSSDDTVVSVFADADDVTRSFAADDSGEESDNTDTSLVQEEEEPREKEFEAESESDGWASGEDYSMAIDAPVVVGPVEAMPVTSLSAPPAPGAAALKRNADADSKFTFNCDEALEAGEQETATTAPSKLSALGVAAMTPPAEESGEGFFQPAFRGPVQDHQDFEKLVEAELLLIKNPDLPPEAPAGTAEYAPSPNDTSPADVDDGMSLPDSELSFEDVFEDAEETWAEEDFSPVVVTSKYDSLPQSPGSFPDDTNVTAEEATVQEASPGFYSAGNSASVQAGHALLEDASTIDKEVLMPYGSTIPTTFANDSPSAKIAPLKDEATVEELKVPSDTVAVEVSHANTPIKEPTEAPLDGDPAAVKVEAAPGETATTITASENTVPRKMLEAPPKEYPVQFEAEEGPHDIAAVNATSDDALPAKHIEALPPQEELDVLKQDAGVSEAIASNDVQHDLLPAQHIRSLLEESNVAVTEEVAPGKQAAVETVSDATIPSDNAIFLSGDTQLVISGDVPLQGVDIASLPTLEDDFSPPSSTLTPAATLPPIATDRSIHTEVKPADATIDIAPSLQKIEINPDELPSTVLQETTKPSSSLEDAPASD